MDDYGDEARVLVCSARVRVACIFRVSSVFSYVVWANFEGTTARRGSGGAGREAGAGAKQDRTRVAYATPSVAIASSESRGRRNPKQETPSTSCQ